MRNNYELPVLMKHCVLSIEHDGCVTQRILKTDCKHISNGQLDLAVRHQLNRSYQ